MILLWMVILAAVLANATELGQQKLARPAGTLQSPPILQSQVNPLLASVLASKSDPTFGQPPCPFNCPSPCPYPCNNQASGAGYGMGIGSIVQRPASCPQQCNAPCPAGCPGGPQASMQPIQSNCPQNCCPQGCPQTQTGALPQLGGMLPQISGGCPLSCFGYGAQQQGAVACPPGCPSAGYFPQAPSAYPQALAIAAYQQQLQQQQQQQACPPSCNPACPSNCQRQGALGGVQQQAGCPQNCCPQGCQGQVMQGQQNLQNMLRLLASIQPPQMSAGCPQQCLSGAQPVPSYCPPACMQQSGFLRPGLVRQAVPSLCPQSCSGTCPAGCQGSMMTGFMQMPVQPGCPPSCCPVGCPQNTASAMPTTTQAPTPVGGCPSQCYGPPGSANNGCPPGCSQAVFELAKKIAGQGIAQPSQSSEKTCPSGCSGTCPSGCGQQQQQQSGAQQSQSSCPQNCCPQGCSSSTASDSFGRFLKFLASFTPPKYTAEELNSGSLPPEFTGGCPNPCPHPCPPGCIPTESRPNPYSMIPQAFQMPYPYQQPQTSYGYQQSPYSQCPSYCPTPQSCPAGCPSGYPGYSGYSVAGLGFSAQYLPQTQQYAGSTPCTNGFATPNCGVGQQQLYGQQPNQGIGYGFAPQQQYSYQQAPCASPYGCGMQQQQPAYGTTGGCSTAGCGMSPGMQQGGLSMFGQGANSQSPFGQGLYGQSSSGQNLYGQGAQQMPPFNPFTRAPTNEKGSLAQLLQPPSLLNSPGNIYSAVNQQNPFQGSSPLTTAGQLGMGQQPFNPFQQSTNPLQQSTNPLQQPFAQQPFNSILRNQYSGQQNSPYIQPQQAVNAAATTGQQPLIHPGSGMYSSQGKTAAPHTTNQAGNTVVVPPTKGKKHKKTD